jgi:hypothetical protein
VPLEGKRGKVAAWLGYGPSLHQQGVEWPQQPAKRGSDAGPKESQHRQRHERGVKAADSQASLQACCINAGVRLVVARRQTGGKQGRGTTMAVCENAQMEP